MAIRIAEVGPNQSPADGIEVQAAASQNIDECVYPERPTALARGILVAILLSIPFWVLFAFVLYLLL